jgi:hypothetical protein
MKTVGDHAMINQHSVYDPCSTHEENSLLTGKFTLAPTITFNNVDNKPMVHIHPDGRVELSPDSTLDEAAVTFWEAVKHLGINVRKQALQEVLDICELAIQLNEATTISLDPLEFMEQLETAGAIAQAKKFKDSVKTLLDAS